MNKARKTYIRDIALNGIGAWVGQDLDARYYGGQRAVAIFTIDKQTFRLEVTTGSAGGGAGTSLRAGLKDDLERAKDALMVIGAAELDTIIRATT